MISFLREFSFKWVKADLICYSGGFHSGIITLLKVKCNKVTFNHFLFSLWQNENLTDYANVSYFNDCFKSFYTIILNCTLEERRMFMLQSVVKFFNIYTGHVSLMAIYPIFTLYNYINRNADIFKILFKNSHYDKKSQFFCDWHMDKLKSIRKQNFITILK